VSQATFWSPRCTKTASAAASTRMAPAWNSMFYPKMNSALGRSFLRSRKGGPRKHSYHMILCIRMQIRCNLHHVEHLSFAMKIMQMSARRHLQIAAIHSPFSISRQSLRRNAVQVSRVWPCAKCRRADIFAKQRHHRYGDFADSAPSRSF
jgi:hypothetical protein